jgi:3-isopropylmalate/(R)-2-methylmalate dehydratase small subunit
MTPFKNFTGLVAPLLHDNIDTDAIIPSREIRSPEKTGFGEKLFSAWRYLDHQQTENPAFILNQDGYRHSSILLAGQNFGCGSSREMAVWALMQFGFKTIIAKSFGEIFRNNCNKNGLLTIALNEQAHQTLSEICQTGMQHLKVDLNNQLITLEDQHNNFQESFKIDPEIKRTLLLGEDEISKTLKFQKEIETFYLADKFKRPWL